MSFILDALKKSESERQRQNAPGLMEAGAARPRTRLPLWAIALAGLLAVNLIVLVVVLTRNGIGGAQVASGPLPALAPGDGAAPGAATKPFSPLDSQPVYAQEIPVPANSGNAARDSNAPAVSRPAPSIANTAKPLRRRDPQLLEGDATRDGDAKPEDDEALPTVSQLSTTGSQALPELHLDVHVFATRSADRFVYVNMRKYHEGAVLEEGPTVERIRRDGVVLNYQGIRFLLPRQ